MPTLHLTDQYIRNLNHPDKRTEYYDESLIENNKIKQAGVKGLALRITPTGNKSFVYRYWYDGKAKRYTIGSYPTVSLKKARDKAENLHEQVSNGIDPLMQKKIKKQEKPPTFKEAIESYKKHHLPTLKESTRTDYKYRIKHLIKGEGKNDTKPRGFDGSRYIKNLKRYEIIDFLNSIAKTSPTQAKRLQAILSGIFKHAKDREWVDTNIASEITLKTKPKRKKDKRKWQNTDLNDKQIKTLWGVFDEHAEPVGSLFKMLMLLGQRSGETRLMKWDDLDFKKQLWTIPASDTKNGKEHYVPLTAMALDILDALKPWTSGKYVFESPVNEGEPLGSPQKSAQRIRDSYDVKDFNIHSLRTTVATRLAGLGTPPQVLSKILNHKKPGEGSLITAIYNKYDYEDEKRTALNRWNAELNRILTGENHKTKVHLLS